MFPGVMLKYKLKFCHKSWGIIYYLLTYNVSDTMGKSLAGNRKLYSIKITFFIFLLRFILIFIYIY